jgi:hypothetical protein
MEFTHHGKSAQGKNGDSATADPGLALLEDVRGIIERSGEPRVFLNLLVESLRPMTGRPWRNGVDDDGVNERWLGHRLAALGVASRRTRVGESRWMACYLEDVVEAMQRKGTSS